jgi:hypothetical protein
MKYTLVGMAIAVTMYGAGVLIERFFKSRERLGTGELG